MTGLAPFVRTLARGPGRSRNLTFDEAHDAMTLVLSGEADREAVGALLMLMRYRGENADEIAGFVTAMRTRLSAWGHVGATLDWPTYAAGRSRGLPYFVLSAALVAKAGVPVLMHGWTALESAPPHRAVEALGLPVADSAASAASALSGPRSFAFVPLEMLDPVLFDLLKLREILGLRSPVNTCLRALNPGSAKASVQGVFHPSYRELQRDAARRLGQPRLLCLKGGGGEFERHPGKDIALFGLGIPEGIDTAAALTDETRRLQGNDRRDLDDLVTLWQGRRRDRFAEAIVIGTASLALLAAGRAASVEQADQMALELWLEHLDISAVA